MKFKDNAFYKTFYELKEKSNFFGPKRVEHGPNSKSYFLDFDIGVAIVVTKLLELNLTNNIDCVDIDLDFKGDTDFNSKAYSPNEALELLEDREINDLEMISFIGDYETIYSRYTFYLRPEDGLVECYSTYQDKIEDPQEDSYDIYDTDEEDILYGIECHDPYAKWDRE